MKINKRKLKQIIREEYKQISETHMDMVRAIQADEERGDREMVYPLRDNMTQKAVEDCAADRRDDHLYGSNLEYRTAHDKKTQEMGGLSETKRRLKKMIREARMGEYGKQDAAEGLPPSKAGKNNEEYMAAYNAEIEKQKTNPVNEGYRDPRTGEDLFLKLNGVVDQLLDMGMDTIELANELRGLADDVEDSGPMEYDR